MRGSLTRVRGMMNIPTCAHVYETNVVTRLSKIYTTIAQGVEGENDAPLLVLGRHQRQSQVQEMLRGHG
jgi:hypothetical protein